jgi:hypothetical protein
MPADHPLDPLEWRGARWRTPPGGFGSAILEAVPDGLGSQLPTVNGLDCLHMFVEGCGTQRPRRKLPPSPGNPRKTTAERTRSRR